MDTLVFDTYQIIEHFFTENFDHKQKDRYKHLNEQAYFVLLFSRFQRFVDDLICEFEPHSDAFFMGRIELLNIHEESKCYDDIKTLYARLTPKKRMKIMIKALYYRVFWKFPSFKLVKHAISKNPVFMRFFEFF